MLEHYLLAVITFMLKLFFLNFTSISETIESVLAIGVFIVIIICPFATWRFLYMEFDDECMLNPKFH